MSDITPEDREALVGQAAYHLRKREEAEEQLAISQKYRSEAERQSTAWARDLEEWRQSFQRVLGERDAEHAAHEATKAESASVHAQLREAWDSADAGRKAAEQRVAELQTRLDMSIERAATLLGRAMAAEQRVAELERDNTKLNDALRDFDEWTADLEPPDVLVHWRADRSALSSARELLEDVITHNLHHMPAELETRLIAWLRAHPEPAEITRKPNTNEVEPWKRPEPATPAAPRTPVLRPEFVALGKALGMQREERIETADPFDSAEKERGT